MYFLFYGCSSFHCLWKSLHGDVITLRHPTVCGGVVKGEVIAECMAESLHFWILVIDAQASSSGLVEGRRCWREVIVRWHGVKLLNFNCIFMVDLLSDRSAGLRRVRATSVVRHAVNAAVP